MHVAASDALDELLEAWYIVEGTYERVRFVL